MINTASNNFFEKIDITHSDSFDSFMIDKHDELFTSRWLSIYRVVHDIFIWLVNFDYFNDGMHFLCIRLFILFSMDSHHLSIILVSMLANQVYIARCPFVQWIMLNGSIVVCRSLVELGCLHVSVTQLILCIQRLSRHKFTIDVQLDWYIIRKRSYRVYLLHLVA
jgi:hypothetical protein